MLVLKRFTSHIGPLLTLTYGLAVNYFTESDAAMPARQQQQTGIYTATDGSD